MNSAEDGFTRSAICAARCKMCGRTTARTAAVEWTERSKPMRLIDADAYAEEMKTRQDACRELIYAAEAECNEEMYDRNSAKFGIFVEAKLTLDAMPTVDAVPVVHGYWRPHPLGYTSNLVKYEEWDVCSNCGIGTKRRNMTDDFFEEYSYSYCPWCGAKMDAKEGIEE